MKVIADLHLHSKYSRAVSQQMVPEVMAEWALKKGVNLLATGDWTHPLWLKELEASLKESEEGVFELKNNLASGVRFILSTEISSIYSQAGKSRRIHNLILAPSFKTVYKINDELKRRGCNLFSDGRPIIGLSSIQLAELVWAIDESCLIIPAHIWTPWFSMFGSKSGFDSIEECWGKYKDRIYAIETGLSSDPLMNWRIKELDTRSIVSFGDSHSPAKIGREMTVFKKKEQKGESREKKQKAKSFNFKDLTGALKQEKDCDWEISYTVEFYPEEGKYHYSGHRNCQIKQAPEETLKKGTICPVCGRPLTLGVMHRVEELAAREAIKPIKKESGSKTTGYYNPLDKKRPPFVMLVPLMEIIAESLNIGISSIKVKNEYDKLIKSLGSELDILTQIKTEKIVDLSGPKIAEGIEKTRSGRITIEPGFDGVFGTVKIWKSGQEESAALKMTNKQECLF